MKYKTPSVNGSRLPAALTAGDNCSGGGKFVEGFSEGGKFLGEAYFSESGNFLEDGMGVWREGNDGDGASLFSTERTRFASRSGPLSFLERFDMSGVMWNG